MCIPKPRTISWEKVKRHVSYDPETGHFTRLVRTGRRHHIGDRADCLDGQGYRFVVIDKERFLAHRLAHFYMTGEWPEHVIDHRDRDGTNNAWNNLKPCTQSENMQNQGPRTNNSTGYKNVYKRGTKYVGQRMVQGVLRRTPLFSTPEAANQALVLLD